MALSLTIRHPPGDESASDTEDMFALEEIKEIADYLMVYYQAVKMTIEPQESEDKE